MLLIHPIEATSGCEAMRALEWEGSTQVQRVVTELQFRMTLVRNFILNDIGLWADGIYKALFCV